MDKSQIKVLDKDKLGRIAVAYLIGARDERPDGLDQFFSKLEKYEISMGRVMTSIEENKKQMMSLQTNADQLYGSISSIVELITEHLPEDKIVEWCEKYKVPEQLVPEINKMASNNVDMAGSTSRQFTPEDINADGPK